MASAKDQAAYPGPPRQWPFPLLGRNAFLIAGLALLALILFPFWGSISVAAVFAFGLSKPVEKLSRRLGNRRRLSAALLVAALTVLVLFPATLFGLRAYEIVATTGAEGGASGMLSARTMSHVQSAYHKVEGWAARYGVGARIFRDGADAHESLRGLVTGALGKALQAASAFAASLPELTITMLVFGLFLYVFLAYPLQIRRFAFRLHLFRPGDLKKSIRILKISSYDSLVANFLVGALQASVITLGAGILGYTEYVLIFSVVFVISYIPFIGAAPVGYAIALLFLLNEGGKPALIMAIIATFTGLIDNIVRPYLVSNGKNEIHPVVSFAAILGAIGVLGLKGIFLGPVILTSTVAFLGAGAKDKKKPGGRVVNLFRRAPEMRRPERAHEGHRPLAQP